MKGNTGLGLGLGLVRWLKLSYTYRPGFEFRIRVSWIRVSSLVFIERNVGGRKLNILVT